MKTAESRDFRPEAAKSPKNQGFHYHQNAGAYMQVGEAMGKGMVALLEKQGCPQTELYHPASIPKKILAR